MLEPFHDASLVEHIAHVGHLAELGNLERVDDHGLAPAGKVENQVVDLGLGTDIDALAWGLSNQKDLGVGVEPARMNTFCWFPPESESTLSSLEFALMLKSFW